MIYVISGMPLHGKTSVAEIVSKLMNIKYLDIDEHIRTPLFREPDPDKDTLSGESDITGGASYQILFSVAETYIQLGWDLLFTATFIRLKRQALLEAFYGKYPDKVKIIRCEMLTDDEAEISVRMNRRSGSYTGGVNTLETYRQVKAASQPLPKSLPHRIIDTSLPKTAEIAAQEALVYFLS